MHPAFRAVAAAALLALPLAAQQDDAALIAKAKVIHAKAIKLDTHVDIDPSMMTDATPNYVTGHAHQGDLPKMRNGGMDGIFFSIFVGQAQDFSDSAYAKAKATDVAKFEAVHYMAEKLAPSQIAIAYTAADVRRIHAQGKLVALMGVENGYGIGTDITNVKKFNDYGARYLLLALKRNGGVMQTVAFATYVKCDAPWAERTAALNALSTEYGIPANQVGRLGGGGGGIDGYNCTSEAINVTIERVRRGYAEAQIIKLWGGNVLRVMEQSKRRRRRRRA